MMEATRLRWWHGAWAATFSTALVVGSIGATCYVLYHWPWVLLVPVGVAWWRHVYDRTRDAVV